MSNIYDIAFLGGNFGGQAETISSLSQQVKPTTDLITIFRMIFFWYGPFAILAVLSGFICFYITIRIVFSRQKFNHFFIILVYCGFLLYIFAFINFFLNKDGFGAFRTYAVAHIFLFISIPIFLGILQKDYSNRKKIIFGIMVLFFILLTVLSVFTCNNSPYFSNKYNDQLTESHFTTMTTFFQYWEFLPWIENLEDPRMFYWGIYGKVKAMNDNIGQIREQRPKKYFGYDEFTTFAESHGKNIYFIYQSIQYTDFIGAAPNPLTSDKTIYLNFDLKQQRQLKNPVLEKNFNALIRLENDNTVNKIFTNTQTTIYYIY